MAGTDSVVQITEGTGKYLHAVQRSVASNTVYQDVFVAGEAYLPTYTAAATTPMTVGANDHLFELQGSTINRLYLRKIEVYQFAGASASTVARFGLYRTTTAGTGGTSYSPIALDPTSSVTTATFRGGLSANKGTNGALLGFWSGVLLASPATAGALPVLEIEWTDPRVQPPSIAAGNANGLALQVLDAVTTATLVITVTFSEWFAS